MYAAFPRSEYYQRVRLPPQHLPPFGRTYRWHTRSTLAQDRGGSPRSLDASFSVRAVLSDPAGVSGILAITGAYCCLPREQLCRPPDEEVTRLNRFPYSTARTSPWSGSRVARQSGTIKEPDYVSTELHHQPGRWGRVAGWRASQGTIKEPDYVSTWPPNHPCLLYTSPSPRDRTRSRMPSSA